MKNLLTVIGARPQFVKASVVSFALKEKGIMEDIINTGQHYDAEMSTVFWEELGIPQPTVNLAVGSKSHAHQTAEIMVKLEDYIMSSEKKYDGLIVYGDTNSTLAAALVASKIHLPLIHVEAGLRSFNKAMPEEVNRIMTDHVSDLLFCSSEIGVSNLKKENITKGVHNVGDVMHDAVLKFTEIANRRQDKSAFSFVADEYYLATVHRPSNTDNDQHLSAIIAAFGSLNKKVVWPVHPRVKTKLAKISLPKNIELIGPQPYLNMLRLLANSAKVLTDSGGLQKEAYWSNKVCITMREETEWVETLENGWNTLVGADEAKIVAAVNAPYPTAERMAIYGEGDASERIAQIIYNS